ncbi:hypothetical protein B0H19DRAFT_1253985 [Mycena capillaripes]|nr:hypothetical protein B0H19DRAFT_1253985 [Mycena capillaripes]
MAQRYSLCGADPLWSYTLAFHLVSTAFTLFLTSPSSLEAMPSRFVSVDAWPHLHCIQCNADIGRRSGSNRRGAPADSSYNATSVSTLTLATYLFTAAISLESLDAPGSSCSMRGPTQSRRRLG